MKLDTHLRAGEVISDREKFLLSVIRYLNDLDNWYLNEWPKAIETLREDFGFDPDV